jgi:hypothetical protein
MVLRRKYMAILIGLNRSRLGVSTGRLCCVLELLSSASRDVA